ncbi:hypothetical protein [Reinekea sp. G2M2-21]|uniref:hypothetical protein n=1 Tax=Reinekea sp. G2M2-21 TaxID=2788942 RepID=UPI0018AA8148|nr:hypothetical protein [Reinekea sp. G2M2-21]
MELNEKDTNVLRRILISRAANRQTIDYKTLADELGFTPPNTIQKTTILLEACQEDDALLNQPQLAAVVVQKRGEPYPRPGFFQQLKRLGVYAGSDSGSQAQMWHQNELEKVFQFYSDA